MENTWIKYIWFIKKNEIYFDFFFSLSFFNCKNWFLLIQLACFFFLYWKLLLNEKFHSIS